MADSVSITIDKDLRPAYYDDFHCLAAGCRLSCCVGWNITFNKKDYLSLKRQTGTDDLNERICTGLCRVRGKNLGENTYGMFTMDGGVCALLRDDGLCQLQMEKGPKALPHVCRTFPRKEEGSPSGYMERSLTPACEGVLELLWNLPDGVEFRSDPLKQECKLHPKTANTLTAAFQNIRSLCIDYLQDRRFTLAERILLMGIALKELADGKTDLPTWLAWAQMLPENMKPDSLMENGEHTLPLVLINNVYTLTQLGKTNNDFAALSAEIIQQVQVRVHSDDGRERITVNPYRAASERYKKQFGDREYFMENLMVSIFFFLHLPHTDTLEDLWKSYINFCNLYSFYRFMAVMSCREGANGDKNDLLRSIVHASRGLIHNSQHQAILRDEYFQNDSATLAHMAILLSG